MDFCSRIKRKLIYLNRFSLKGRPRISKEKYSDEVLSFSGKSAFTDFSKMAGELFSDYSKNTRVLIKVNLNSANEYPASVSIDFLGTLVSILKEQGVKGICIADCSGVTHLPTSNVIKQKKIKERLTSTGVKIRSFDHSVWVRVPVGGMFFKTILMPKVLYRYDKIINLSNLKSHQHAGFSAATKNLVGFMHPAQRKELHNDHLSERIAEISLAIEPDINIIDAREIFISGGPDSGTVAITDTIIVSRSLLDADLKAYSLLVDTKAGNGISDLPIKPKDHPLFRHIYEMRSDIE